MVGEYLNPFVSSSQDPNSIFYEQVDVALSSITEPPYTGIPEAFTSRYSNADEIFATLLDLTGREVAFNGGGLRPNLISGLDLFKKLFAYSYEQNMRRGGQIGDTVLTDIKQNEDGAVKEVGGFKPTLTIILNCLMWTSFPQGMKTKTTLSRDDMESTFAYNFIRYTSPDNPAKSFFTLMGGMSEDEAGVVFNTAIAVNDVMTGNDSNIAIDPEKSKKPELKIPDGAQIHLVFYRKED